MRDNAFMPSTLSRVTGTPMILHSFDPWLIARYRPNQERVACASLGRAGFEAYAPSYVHIRPLPLRKVPPRKRHVRHLYVEETRCPRFVGYIFIRTLAWCRQDPNRLAELPGCGALVSVGGVVAKVEDFDIELMRLAEARGTFDTVIGVGRRRYRIAKLQDDRQWVGQNSRLLNREDARTLQLSVGAFGHVSRVLKQAEQEASRTGTTPRPVMMV